MDIIPHKIDLGGEINLILGQTHFIKTVSDLAGIVAASVPGVKFAVIFNEASGPCLIRTEGNSESLIEKGVAIMKDIAAGHTFLILLENAFPINMLTKVKLCDEVCGIYAATANPLTVLTVKNEIGAGIIGVIDGESPKGVENEDDKAARKAFLQKIGYAF
ncbi:MAG: adenosine-specific kinase [Spirochaetales bacterium]|nr:adenosine-specific kinase [Spirochaetales bacterium]